MECEKKNGTWMIIPSGGKDAATFVVLRETGGHARHQNLTYRQFGDDGVLTTGRNWLLQPPCSWMVWCGWGPRNSSCRCKEIVRGLSHSSESRERRNFNGHRLRFSAERRNSIARHPSQSKEKETLALLVSESYPTALQQPP